MASTARAADPPPEDWVDPKGTDPAQFTDLEFVFHRVTTALFQVAGIVAFVFLLIGGFKYLTSSGDEDALEQAQKTITYAAIGLLVVLGSWLLLDVLGQTLNIDFLQFEIPGS